MAANPCTVAVDQYQPVDVDEEANTHHLHDYKQGLTSTHGVVVNSAAVVSSQIDCFPNEAPHGAYPQPLEHSNAYILPGPCSALSNGICWREFSSTHACAGHLGDIHLLGSEAQLAAAISPDRS